MPESVAPASSAKSGPFRRAIANLYAQFGSRDDDEAVSIRRTVVVLIRRVIGLEGEARPEDYEAIRRVLNDRSPRELDEILALMDRPAAPADEAATAAVLNRLPEESRQRLVSELLQLAVGTGRLGAIREELSRFAAKLGVGEEEFEAIERDHLLRFRRRRRIIKSGAGIAVALIVIVVFILTATLLRSVIFGLIAAYIMLPVEKFFERRLSNRSSILFKISHFCSRLTEPLRLLSIRVRRQPPAALSPAERARRDQRQLIAKAVSLTGLTLLLVFLVLATALGIWTGNYVGQLKTSAEVRAAANAAQKQEQDRQVQTEAAASAEAAKPAGEEGANEAAGDTAAPAEKKAHHLEVLLEPVLRHIEDLRDRLDRVPIVQYALSELSSALNDEVTQHELIKMFLKRTGGFFAFLAGVAGWVVTVLLDVLLTIFFFLLFLTKIAEFTANNRGDSRDQSRYLVRTVFNGNWLPGAGEETLNEAERIIAGVIDKLKIWLKGYLTLMLVDMTVYTTAFYFLKVPYFFILGPLAGCGILLPYIGPVASAVLTLAVTIAVSGPSASALQLFGIVMAYLIYNGVIEQFILYPMVIGESLGLSTLETIIVVLLGAIFAGIVGMILALPTAAVIKYLVPQIYHCFDRRDPAAGEPPPEETMNFN